MSVLVGKLTTLIYGDFYCQVQNESKQKRPPWQEVVFRVDENCGRLSPQGGDLVQKSKKTDAWERFCGVFRVCVVILTNIAGVIHYSGKPRLLEKDFLISKTLSI